MREQESKPSSETLSKDNHAVRTRPAVRKCVDAATQRALCPGKAWDSLVAVDTGGPQLVSCCDGWKERHLKSEGKMLGQVWTGEPVTHSGS